MIDKLSSNKDKGRADNQNSKEKLSAIGMGNNNQDSYGMFNEKKLEKLSDVWSRASNSIKAKQVRTNLDCKITKETFNIHHRNEDCKRGYQRSI